jgi:deoxyribodipyrimidine photo-lyase
MHNRVRMVVASFLSRTCLRWHRARHFLDHLTDGDLASNSHGWQWVAGTGTDAAPYFRIFNPITQGLTADPDGDYVRRFVPELAHLPGAAVHQPWRDPSGLAHGYPERIVDHAEERVEAGAVCGGTRRLSRRAARTVASRPHGPQNGAMLSIATALRLPPPESCRTPARRPVRHGRPG